MNKQELIASMAEFNGETKKANELALDAFMGVVGETLSKGEKIQLVGFGSFEVVDVKPKLVGNPKDTSIPKWMTEASRKPKFKAGKLLKDIVK